MNPTDDTDSHGAQPFRWYAHPLTTLVFLIPATVLIALTFDQSLALTVFAGAIAFVTACSGAYDNSN